MSGSQYIIDLNLKQFRYNSNDRKILDEIEFKVKENEFVSILGPSGCGKTTLLKLIAGLLKTPTNLGKVRIYSTCYYLPKGIDHPHQEINYIFQDSNRSLLPWFTVAENINWGIRKKHLSDRETIISKILEATELENYADNFPFQLSGGLRQRVALARAIAYKPKILLLDEPFSSLDVFSRMNLEDLLLKLWEELKLTIVLVTHTIDEAVYLSQIVHILSQNPAKIHKAVEINLPEKFRTSAKFEEYRNEIIKYIDEVRNVVKN
jgi:NitT/TauT family transport system ATP-binding protein